jgi:hypothetical protein
MGRDTENTGDTARIQSSRNLFSAFARRVFCVLRVPICCPGRSSARRIPPCHMGIFATTRMPKNTAPRSFRRHAAGPSVSVQNIIPWSWHNPVTSDKNLPSFFAQVDRTFLCPKGADYVSLGRSLRSPRSMCRRTHKPQRGRARSATLGLARPLGAFENIHVPLPRPAAALRCLSLG